jgi:hypothetical protein
VCVRTNCGEQPVEGMAGDIAMLPVGATLEMSAVLGKGFDMSKADKASDILIFATGSGIRCRLAFPSVLSPPGHLSSSGRKKGAGDGAFGALEHGKACDGHVGQPSLLKPPLSYAAMVTNCSCTGLLVPGCTAPSGRCWRRTRSTAGWKRSSATACGCTTARRTRQRWRSLTASRRGRRAASQSCPSSRRCVG